MSADDSQLSSVMQQADSLFQDKKFKELYDFLKERVESGQSEYMCAEIYWRLARVSREMANLDGTNKDQNKAFMYEGFEYAKKSLELDPENWAANKWYAILLDLTGRFEGIKQRIKNSFVMKEHFLKAVAINPKDATTIHALGVWCFEVSDMSWLQRKAAAALFAAPPESTYEEALNYLLDAEKIEANFYSHNLLYIGKTYLRLKQLAEARQYLERTTSYDGNSFDDQKAKEEARELLKKC